MINFNLKVLPQTSPETWENFCEKYPINSIALDGFVKDSTKFIQDKNGFFANFNHHENVDRLSTRATCSQILLAIRQGFSENLYKRKFKEVNIYVNDCDQDVCLSVYLLKNYWRVKNAINPLLNKLVGIEDVMDTCSGLYPYPVDMPTLREVMWIFEPYTLFRDSGRLLHKDSAEYESIIEDVMHRIDKYLNGDAKFTFTYSEFEVKQINIVNNYTWHLVTESGPESRMIMVNNGIDSFVSIRHDGKKFSYVIGKNSPYNTFPIEQIINNLNIEEAKQYTIIYQKEFTDKWGGSNTIAGSPRVNGSVLSPEEVTKVINATLENE